MRFYVVAYELKPRKFITPRNWTFFNSLKCGIFLAFRTCMKLINSHASRNTQKSGGGGGGGGESWYLQNVSKNHQNSHDWKKVLSVPIRIICIVRFWKTSVTSNDVIKISISLCNVPFLLYNFWSFVLFFFRTFFHLLSLSHTFYFKF